MEQPTFSGEATVSPAFEPAPQPSETAAPTTAQTDGNDGLLTFSDWPAVLTELMQINPPLWGVLNNSTAFESGEFVLIKSDNPTVPSFIKTGTNGRDVKEAIFRATGKKRRLGIHNPKPIGETSEKKRDPLEDLVQKARGLGVNVDVE